MIMNWRSGPTVILDSTGLISITNFSSVSRGEGPIFSRGIRSVWTATGQKGSTLATLPEPAEIAIPACSQSKARRCHGWPGAHSVDSDRPTEYDNGGTAQSGMTSTADINDGEQPRHRAAVSTVNLIERAGGAAVGSNLQSGCRFACCALGEGVRGGNGPCVGQTVFSRPYTALLRR